MRTAIERRGVAVVVMPGEMFLRQAPRTPHGDVGRADASIVRPSDAELAAPPTSSTGHRVTILAGAGCQGAHDELIAVADRLKAPVVHALRGKEFVEYDNPYDVGMTGLLGYASGYRAMEHCDALLMFGTDFPYRPFFPDTQGSCRSTCAGRTSVAGFRSTSPWSAPSRKRSRRYCPTCGTDGTPSISIA